MHLNLTCKGGFGCQQKILSLVEYIHFDTQGPELLLLSLFFRRSNNSNVVQVEHTGDSNACDGNGSTSDNHLKRRI